MYTLNINASTLKLACSQRQMHTITYASLSYTCLRTQPAGKTIEHVMKSFKWILLILEKKTEAISVHLISNSKRESRKRRLHKYWEERKMRTGRIWIGQKWTVTTLAMAVNANHSKTSPSLFMSVCLSVCPPCSILSQYKLCNFFKMYTMFLLEGAAWVTRSDCES